MQPAAEGSSSLHERVSRERKIRNTLCFRFSEGGGTVSEHLGETLTVVSTLAVTGTPLREADAVVL